MRWVRRADSGAFHLEYAALVVLVAAVAVSLFAFGLPTRVASQMDAAICRIVGNKDCANENGDGPSRADGKDNTSDNNGGSGPDNGTTPVDDVVTSHDKNVAQSYEDAQNELEKAKEERSKARSKYNSLDEELLNTIADVVGLTDAKKCLTEGDLVACLWTVVGLNPFGKGAKLVSRIPKIVKLFNRWRKYKKAKEVAESAVGPAQRKLDNLAEKATTSCKVSSFLPQTNVLLANGAEVPISQVDVGDKVLSADPTSGDMSAQPVSAVISTSGKKKLVNVAVDNGNPGINRFESVTATHGHPFWVNRGGGWGWIDAEDLRSGDLLLGNSGKSWRVTGIKTSHAVQRVNNLTVERYQTYFVSFGSVTSLVHNCTLKQLSGPGRPFKSPSGLVFKDRKYKKGDQHALQHVLEHSTEKAGKAKHGVFKEDGNALQTVDDAWKNRNKPGVRTEQQGGKTAYWIPFDKNVGTDGEKYVKIIVENGKEVVSAFPVKSRRS